MQLPELTPLWDEAIAGILYDDHEANEVPLSIDRLQELALEHTTRLGDIMETLYLMAIYGDWAYSDENGVSKELDESALDRLYAVGRIDQSNSSEFAGFWTPAK